MTDAVEKGWNLRRRFFLFDTVTLITENQNEGNTDFDFEPPSGSPSYVRYAKKISMHISLDMKEGNEEMLNVPYFKIEYAYMQK